jgi:hypothetical protein
MLVSSFLFPEVATITREGLSLAAFRIQTFFFLNQSYVTNTRVRALSPKNSFPVIAGNGSW